MDDIKALEKVLKALANRRRLAIVKRLLAEKEVTVGDLAHGIRLSFKATSKHLAILAGVDMVEKEQRSLQVWYRISKEYPKIVKHISHQLSSRLPALE